MTLTIFLALAALWIPILSAAAGFLLSEWIP